MKTKLVFLIGALAIAASGAVLVLGALIGLSESHTATPVELWYIWIQGASGIAAVAWSVAAIVLLVSGRTSLAALAAISIGHLLVWLSWPVLPSLESMVVPIVLGVVVVGLMVGWRLLLKAFTRAAAGA